MSGLFATGADPVERFRRLVHQRSGLMLGPDKDYLLKSRLEPVARAAGLSGLGDLFANVARFPDGELAQQALDAMATHESFFFRDGAPFILFEEVILPRLIAARREQRSLRIWSAACSSGQEPYSIAMVLLEQAAKLAGGRDSWRLEVVATDLSQPILSRAKAGVYSDFEARRGLSQQRLERWFEPYGPAWRIRPAIRNLVRFEAHNLLDGPGGLGRFDVIFCRNVLIYFDAAGKAAALRGLASALADDGVLMLGSAETVVGLDSPFAPAPGQRGAFQLKNR